MPEPSLRAVIARAEAYRAAEKDVSSARRRLYAAIRTASANGASLRQLAAATGLSFPRIQQIVADG